MATQRVVSLGSQIEPIDVVMHIEDFETQLPPIVDDAAGGPPPSMWFEEEDDVLSEVIDLERFHRDAEDQARSNVFREQLAIFNSRLHQKQPQQGW